MAKLNIARDKRDLKELQTNICVQLLEENSALSVPSTTEGLNKKRQIRSFTNLFNLLASEENLLYAPTVGFWATGRDHLRDSPDSGENQQGGAILKKLTRN